MLFQQSGGILPSIPQGHWFHTSRIPQQIQLLRHIEVKAIAGKTGLTAHNGRFQKFKLMFTITLETPKQKLLNKANMPTMNMTPDAF